MPASIALGSSSAVFKYAKMRHTLVAGSRVAADHSSPAAVTAALAAGCDFAPCFIETAISGEEDVTLSDMAVTASVIAHLHRLHDGITAAAPAQHIAPEFLSELSSTQLWLPAALQSSQYRPFMASGAYQSPIPQIPGHGWRWVHMSMKKLQAKLSSLSASKSPTSQPYGVRFDPQPALCQASSIQMSTISIHAGVYLSQNIPLPHQSAFCTDYGHLDCTVVCTVTSQHPQ